MYELTSIRFSHYVEKVRWTMDYLQVPYSERPLLPIIHFFVVPWIVGLQGRSDSHSSRFSTPLLKTPDGQLLCKSTTIMKYLCQHHTKSDNDLYFSPECEQWDQQWNEKLGPHVRRLAYFHLLQEKEVILKAAAKNVRPWQSHLFRAFFPLAKTMLKQGLNISAQSAEQSQQIIQTQWDEAAQLLKDGRPYLLGQRFSAADISFAALAGALLFVSPQEGYGAYLPAMDELPASLRKSTLELRQSSVGQWVLKLFKEKRGQRLLPCYPLLT